MNSCALPRRIRANSSCEPSRRTGKPLIRNVRCPLTVMTTRHRGGDSGHQVHANPEDYDEDAVQPLGCKSVALESS